MCKTEDKLISVPSEWFEIKSNGLEQKMNVDCNFFYLTVRFEDKKWQKIAQKSRI